ncbi:MAG: precorrin-8X methylmutase [Pseudomonadota bacterium]
MIDYVRDPAEIYAQSFATIEREVDLSSYSSPMAQVVTRLIHACGMTDIVDDIAFSGGAAEAGLQALKRGCAIFCDVEMVRAGIVAKALPDNCQLTCTLNDPRAAQLGKASHTTRSAAAVDLWDGLDGSICVIGNAPTALFRLLERIEDGAGIPALIVGIPVGFVGAVESKQALAENPRGCHFITVQGRRGGSAMASSVVNALAGQLK